MTSLIVLGIPVTDEQIARWLGWYCPGRQPFRVRELGPAQRGALPAADQVEITDELRDTFFLYGGGPWAWLTEDELRSLEPGLRGALAEERRRRVRPKPVPAWPTDPMIQARLVRWMEAGTRPSLHLLAQEELRRSAAGPLPRATELAGTFPPGSGPNCFGAVMAAAGEDVADDWVETAQFRTWLARSTRPAGPGDRGETGQVLVWSENGEPVHAAVTLGGGWVLQKPSQSWSSPTGVWPADEVVRAWQLSAVRLTRHRLHG